MIKMNDYDDDDYVTPDENWKKLLVMIWVFYMKFKMIIRQMYMRARSWFLKKNMMILPHVSKSQKIEYTEKWSIYTGI